MTADLTPLLERQKALRRQLSWGATAFVVISISFVAWQGLTGWSVLFAVVCGICSVAGAQNWRKRHLDRLELEQTTAAIATQRALLRRSGERRDAEAGLSISDDAAGGELTVGQDGELSEDR